MAGYSCRQAAASSVGPPPFRSIVDSNRAVSGAYKPQLLLRVH
jgi:hypothetical protein